MNPGSPAPQAGILDQTRRICTKIPTKSKAETLTRRRPPKIPTKQKELIINTLIYLKNNGKAENTVKSVNRCLTRISRHADLARPEEVKTYIANAKREDNGKPLSNGSKSKLAFCYNCLCKAHNINWEMPRFKWIETVPIIPTTANVEKIISASTKRYATIFTILAETGAEGQELHNVSQNDIDTEQGIISIRNKRTRIRHIQNKGTDNRNATRILSEKHARTPISTAKSNEPNMAKSQKQSSRQH